MRESKYQSHLATSWEDDKTYTLKTDVTILDTAYINPILDLSNADSMAALFGDEGHRLQFGEIEDAFIIATDGKDAYLWVASNADDNPAISADELTLWDVFEGVGDLTYMEASDFMQ